MMMDGDADVDELAPDIDQSVRTNTLYLKDRQ